MSLLKLAKQNILGIKVFIDILLNGKLKRKISSCFSEFFTHLELRARLFKTDDVVS